MNRDTQQVIRITGIRNSHSPTQSCTDNFLRQKGIEFPSCRTHNVLSHSSQNSHHMVVECKTVGLVVSRIARLILICYMHGKNLLGLLRLCCIPLRLDCLLCSVKCPSMVTTELQSAMSIERSISSCCNGGGWGSLWIGSFEGRSSVCLCLFDSVAVRFMRLVVIL
jgi:hypothetical protein